MDSPKKNAPNRLPMHGADPTLGPAESFMAEQQAMVAPRRAAFDRLALAREHAEFLPSAGGDVPPAEPVQAPFVNAEGAVDERPTPDFAPRKRPAADAFEG